MAEKPETSGDLRPDPQTADLDGGLPSVQIDQPHVASLRQRRLLELGQQGGLVTALVLLIIVFTSMSPYFLTQSNAKVILLQVSVVGIIAVPGAMLLLAGYVDLSVGSVAVLSAVAFGRLAGVEGMPIWGAILLALLVGALWGFAQGFLICQLGFSPIVVTLGSLAGARGLAELINNSRTESGFGDVFAWIGNGNIFGYPVPIYAFGIAFIVGGYVWYLSPWARHMMAIGADRVAARSLGVNVRRIPWLLYTMSGLAAGVGGLIVASQLDSASVSIGQGTEIAVLTAILLGGVAFTGGRGSLVGVLVGVIFIGVLRNGLLVVNTNPFLFGVVVGLAMIGAAGLEVLYQRLDRVQLQDPGLQVDEGAHDE
ncbi:MAG: ABC transporter permease [Armatimonadetes bacterium]|nr:MAG: ABC transporter permease [Armatimonadota bacterium]